jgi:hypothetical protein
MREAYFRGKAPASKNVSGEHCRSRDGERDDRQMVQTIIARSGRIVGRHSVRPSREPDFVLGSCSAHLVACRRENIII